MDERAPVVETNGGAVAGRSADGVSAFLGIPYAASPAFAGRWRAPQPAQAWTGVRDGTAFGADPIQVPVARKRSRAPGLSEDALSLNVWAPADRAAGPYPVMVWIEGGSFVTGTGASARVDGANFARRGVVIVTMNYRVGVFGYLAHPKLSAESDVGASGNYGFMDQLAALRWVRENIAAFGGDAANVTVFGVSAGSASIALMLVSPHARGLIDKAILQSPGSLRPLCTLASAEAQGRAVGDDLDELRALPPEDVLAFNDLLTPRMRGLTTPRALRPIRDGYMVPKEEAVAYDEGDFHAVPAIIGSCANEGGWAVGGWPIDTIESYYALMEQNFGTSTGEALERYPVFSDADVKPQLAEVFGDTQFSYGARGLARAMARRQAKTFRYVFAHGPSGHSDDTSYIFGTEEEAAGEADRMISDAMMRYWVQFAHAGDPNAPGLPAWPAYDSAGDRALTFGEDAIAVTSGWRRSNLDFLDRYFRSRR